MNYTGGSGEVDWLYSLNLHDHLTWISPTSVAHFASCGFTVGKPIEEGSVLQTIRCDNISPGKSNVACFIFGALFSPLYSRLGRCNVNAHDYEHQNGIYDKLWAGRLFYSVQGLTIGHVAARHELLRGGVPFQSLTIWGSIRVLARSCHSSVSPHRSTERRATKD